MPAQDAEVAAVWAAALREWADASVPGLSVAGAFMHVYQAALRAASAMLRAAGYRVRGAVGGHHHATFYALGALGGDELERLADLMQGIRGGRRTALYGDDQELEPEDLEKARRDVYTLLGEVHRTLADRRPALVLQPPVSS